MNTYAKVASANRHKVRSLYVLAALYVIIGLGVAALSAVNGEPLGAFLGFLIVSCTIGGTALLRAIWRLNAQAAALSDRLAAISAFTHRLEHAAHERERITAEEAAEPTQLLDLAAIGAGDPSPLTAAVLPRASYPRLAQALEERDSRVSGPPTSVGPDVRFEKRDRVANNDLASQPTNGAKTSRGSGNGHLAPHESSDAVQAADEHAEEPGPMSNVMMRRWKRAYREGDLQACREVFSAFEPIADADLVRSMHEQLEEVVQRTERRLRLQFQQLVHEQQFDQALRVGGEIMRLLPNRPIAREFSRIRPHLERKASVAAHA